MDAKTFASMLTGAKYPFQLSRDFAVAAKTHGLVVVYGASDDLMEFEGAIYDELGAYNGTTALLDTRGLLPEREQIDNDDDLRDYFAREPHAVAIRALWESDGYSWTYQTDIPHSTFEVMADGEPYCRGIVFSLSDAKVAP